MMPYRIRAQIVEILGNDNRWFCSKFYGRQIDDHDLLAHYFCAHGGADDFRRRWNEAMDHRNIWFAGEYHRRKVTDQPTLWAYYKLKELQAAGKLGGSTDDDEDGGELSLA